MIKIAAFIAALSAGLCLHAQKETNVNKLSPQEKQDGWELLFDGKSLKGWHNYGYDNPQSPWKVKNNAVYLDTATRSSWTADKSHDLVSNAEYSDFDLKLDWNISKNGNSGIIFYVHEDKEKYPNTYETGLEMQVLDNNGHPDGKIVKHRAGNLYDLIASSSEPVNPPGEWNTAEIVSRKGRLDLYLNGVHVVSTTLWDENWKQMVANSKFKSMPGFGTFKTGHIALQEHGEEVKFRNIKIRKI